ncbi:MAG: GTPase RsgA, partial [Planctomycetota bacterium]
MAKKRGSKRRMQKRVKRYREHQKDKQRERDLAGRYEADDLGDLETTKERVGSRKTRADTRLEVIQMAAKAYEERGYVTVSEEDKPEQNGRVLEILGPVSRVEVADEVLECILHMELRAFQSADKNFLVVGDRVSVRPTPADETDGIIVAVFRRDSWLSRRSTRQKHVERVIASNVDTMCIVSSVDDPPLRPALIDRFLVAAAVGNLEPVIVVNKIDLVGDE